MDEQTKSHVLVVDDDKSLLKSLQEFLKREGFQTSLAYDGAEALDAIKQHRYDVIILDNDMPKLSGRDVLRYIHGQAIPTPVIFLSGLDAVADKIGALNGGADDYISKPVDPQELLARIQVVLRRVERGLDLDTSRYLISQDLVVDKNAQRVKHHGKQVNMTGRAIDLLIYLMRHPDMLLSREQILDNVWGIEAAVSDRNVLDPRIAEIRRMLKDDDLAHPLYIKTEYGRGYRFIAPVEGRK